MDTYATINYDKLECGKYQITILFVSIFGMIYDRIPYVYDYEPTLNDIIKCLRIEQINRTNKHVNKAITNLLTSLYKLAYEYTRTTKISIICDI